MGSISTQSLLDKTAGIVIVEPTMSIAGTIRRVFLESGYSNVYIAHSILDAINTATNNVIHWMFVSPLMEEKLNQWHCLRLPLEVTTFSDIMISVLVNPETMNFYEDYFAFGALSIHPRQLTFNTFQEELGELFERLKSHKTVEQAIADDVRGRFKKKGETQKIEKLEEILSERIDTSPAQKLRLIEAKLRAQSNIEGMMEIRNLATEHPELQGELKHLTQKYLGTADLQTFRGTLPISNVLILDPDSSQQQFMRTLFTELGAENIVCCDTMEAACHSLASTTFDVLITEWKLQDVKGHSFIQHVRHHKHERQPVFVHSSLIKPEDLPLIQEIGGVFVIPKPTTKNKFKQILSDAIERWTFPQEGEDQGEKILNDLNAGKLDEALSINEGFQKNPKVEKKLKDLVNATIAYHQGRLQEAKDLILKNAKSSVPSHKEISLLGKTLLRLGDASAALKFLEQANQMVPGNIDRLCQLADANAGAGHSDKALQVAGEALKIGGDVDIVQSTFAKHAVAAGEIDEAQEYLRSEETAREMIAFMNNLGIAHAGAQKWEVSDKSYRDALRALNGRHPALQGLVSYNFGLSLSRQNRLSEALKFLKDAEIMCEASIRRKAADLRERVEKAITVKQPLVLKEVLREIASPRSKSTKSVHAEYKGKAKVDFHGLFGVLTAPGLAPGMDLSTDLPKVAFRLDKAE